LNKRHFKLLRTSHRVIIRLITKTRWPYGRSGAEHDTEEYYLREYERLVQELHIDNQSDEEKDEQTRYDNQFETTLINWETIFLTIEGAASDSFMATPEHPNTGLGYLHQRRPISQLRITGERNTSTGDQKLQFVMGYDVTYRGPLLNNGIPPPPHHHHLSYHCD
jgi:hypothetical protein